MTFPRGILIAAATVTSLNECSLRCLGEPACESINYNHMDKTCILNANAVYLPDSLAMLPGYSYGLLFRAACAWSASQPKDGSLHGLVIASFFFLFFLLNCLCLSLGHYYRAVVTPHCLEIYVHQLVWLDTSQNAFEYIGLPIRLSHIKCPGRQGPTSPCASYTHHTLPCSSHIKPNLHWISLFTSQIY